jgi:hypothetical protein
MEVETTDAAGAVESPALSFSWYVSLAQLPGVPLRPRAACLDTAREALARLPVACRRQHAWRGVLPPADAATPEETELFLAEADLAGAPAPA